MSGGGLGGISPVQILDPIDSTTINAANSALGTNILGQGGMSNNLMTKLGNSITGWNVANAGNLQNPGGASAGALPSTLTPNGSTTPIFTSPLSWAPRQAPGTGPYNAMAAQLAGPVYTGGLQIPGVSPALLNQPLGAQGKGGAAAAGNTPGSPPAASVPASIQQKLAALRAGGLNNGFVPTPVNPGFGLLPRGSIQPF